VQDNSRSNKKRDKHEIERDRYLVADLHAKGLNFQQITDELNNRYGISYSISPTTVRRDYEWNLKRWRKQALVPTQADIEEQLIGLRQTRAEAWAAWERSKQDSEQVREVQRLMQKVEDDPNDAVLVTETIETLRKGQSGNDRFLKIVIDCWDREARLKGLYTDRLHVQVEKKEEIQIKMYGHVSPQMWSDTSIEVIDGIIHKDGKPVTVVDGEIYPLLEEKNGESA